MKFYDIDVLAKKYGGGNKYLATSLIAESACRLSEKRNPDDNDPEKEKYLSEILAQFDKGVEIERIIHEEVSHEEISPEEVLFENDLVVNTTDE